ncbi:AMP-binding protein [Streptomyces sp. NPDC058623]|uniref:AMP-binding protein n=1 Tax=Streptomyces sp. NPDC058623 TaxID=3346563 RepID=UPI0036553836
MSDQVGTGADVVRPLPQLLREHARSRGDKVAFEDRRTRLTYRELERRTGRLAGHLAGLGVARGERVAILSCRDSSARPGSGPRHRPCGVPTQRAPSWSPARPAPWA